MLQAPETWLARVVFALPPDVVFLSFELLMGQTGAAVKRQGVVAALADLLAQLDTQRAEADALVSKIAELVSRRDALQAETAKLGKARNTASLGSLDDANAARAVVSAGSGNRSARLPRLIRPAARSRSSLLWARPCLTSTKVM